MSAPYARRRWSGPARRIRRLPPSWSGSPRAQRAAGVSPAIDVTRAQAQLANGAGLLLVAKNQLNRGRIDVTRALGLDPATPLAFADSLAPLLGAADVPVQRDSAVGAALGNRPELRARAGARRGGAADRIGDPGRTPAAAGAGGRLRCERQDGAQGDLPRATSRFR